MLLKKKTIRKKRPSARAGPRPFRANRAFVAGRRWALISTKSAGAVDRAPAEGEKRPERGARHHRRRREEKKSRVEAAPREEQAKGRQKAKKAKVKLKRKEKPFAFSSQHPPRVVALGPFWPRRAPRHSAASVRPPMRPREDGEEVPGANKPRLKGAAFFASFRERRRQRVSTTTTSASISFLPGASWRHRRRRPSCRRWRGPRGRARGGPRPWWRRCWKREG